MPHEESEVSRRSAATLGIHSNLIRHGKLMVGFVAVSAFNYLLFCFTLESIWLRALLPAFGLCVSTFWACINIVWPIHRFHYQEATEIAIELDLFPHWFGAVLLAALNVMLGTAWAVVWVYAIANHVAIECLSTVESFVSFVSSMALFAISLPIYSRAASAECSLILECDHVLRETALTEEARQRVFEITCPECWEHYYTPEPSLTRGFCKQCYAHQRFEADWWVGACAFGILVWSVGLRQLATHLVHDESLKRAVWIGLFLLSGLLWWPLVRGRWHVLFYLFYRHRRRQEKREGSELEAVPPPRLIADPNGLKGPLF